jgi:tRNA pseudouridine55 synthase
VDGILVALKPAGPTSHDIVALVRRLAATKRVGHGGTLDPFASGVLPLFLGRATRVVEYHLGDRKGYRATVCFGATSTTDDLEGELTPVDAPSPGRQAVEAALGRLRGPISQRPPAYSAIKVAGRRAYAMARAGESVELASRDVTIHRLDLVEWDGSDPDRPIGILEVECSAGTYIRALARDLGALVGSGAYLGALSRTSSGPFRLDEAIPLERVREAAADGPDALAALLLPIDAGLDSLPELVITDGEVTAISRGQFIRAALPPGEPDAPIRVRDGAGRLVAIATVRDGRLAPDKVLVDALPVTRTADV